MTIRFTILKSFRCHSERSEESRFCLELKV